jgi:hypothetical protein
MPVHTAPDFIGPQQHAQHYQFSTSECLSGSGGFLLLSTTWYEVQARPTSPTDPLTTAHRLSVTETSGPATAGTESNTRPPTPASGYSNFADPARTHCELRTQSPRKAAPASTIYTTAARGSPAKNCKTRAHRILRPATHCHPATGCESIQ